MEEKQNEKTPIVGSKSFLAFGPTLHYSHENVQWCWLLSVVIFGSACVLWSKILTGFLWSFSFDMMLSPRMWHLSKFTTSGLSIFEYPWQILVLGLIMGIMSIAPILTSQLMSFSYSVPFILAVAFLANLPGLALSLLISCIAVACRPLRFRSRFIAVVLCTAPQLIYLGYYGGIRGVEPIKWGFSFTPWVCAWIVGIAIAGLVLGMGHFTRYRPGLVWTVTAAAFLIAGLVFQKGVGFDELDYQLYVAKNNPEQAAEFHEHSITEILDQTIKSPAVKRYLAEFFYPTEPILLRAELKKEIQMQLSQGRWPSWLRVPPELNYQARRTWLLGQYDSFITRRPKSPRMPIVLYFKALLNEYSPDIRALEQREVVEFYSEYPFERSREIWYQLYSGFGQSPESLESRWRIARHLAGQGRFEQADKLLAEAETMLADRLKLLEKEQPAGEGLFSQFRSPPASVITASKLVELQRELNQLRTLISPQNRTAKEDSARRLASFVMLNPNSEDYAGRLNELLEKMPENDPLRDNILLAQAELVDDDQLQADKLSELHKKYQNTDGGMNALYELGLLKIRLWRQQGDTNPEQKKKCLFDARATLSDFLKLYPTSFYSEQVKKNLDNLPTAQ
jgi:hypothetical protein